MQEQIQEMQRIINAMKQGMDTLRKENTKLMEQQNNEHLKKEDETLKNNKSQNKDG